MKKISNPLSRVLAKAGVYFKLQDCYNARLDMESNMADAKEAKEEKKAKAPKKTQKKSDPSITPNATLTFTIKSEPRRPAARKTIERLMWMQPHAKKDLSMLQRRRKQKDIKYTIRAGRVWFDRPRATRTVRCEKGASFTLQVTPQIVNDLKSVEKYLTITAA